MTGTIRAHQYLACPACGKGEFRVDHVLAGEFRQFGPWFCDVCDYGFTGRLVDGRIETESSRETRTSTVDLLVLRPHDTPVYFIVRGARHAWPEGHLLYAPSTDEHESKRYLYEEHSCPTNWLRPEMVYVDGDADPHGLIKFVAARDASLFPPEEDHGPNARDAALVAFIHDATRG